MRYTYSTAAVLCSSNKQQAFLDCNPDNLFQPACLTEKKSVIKCILTKYFTAFDFVVSEILHNLVCLILELLTVVLFEGLS